MKKKRKQKRHNRAHAAANDCINERLAEAALAFHNGERFCWPGQNHLQRFDKRGEKSFLLPVIPWQTGASTRRCDGRNRPRTRGLRLRRNRGARRWNGGSDCSGFRKLSGGTTLQEGEGFGSHRAPD